MKVVFARLCWLIILALAPLAAGAQTVRTIDDTRRIVDQLIERSYPELKDATIELKSFQSETNYFKSQFSAGRFLTLQKLHYTIYVNPEVFKRKAPDEGIRAILAHELAHVLYYKRKNRFELLGLVSLAGKDFTARFERRADLEAIARGYGAGLAAYRQWLYENIPESAVAAKKRDYFTPAEIAEILRILREKPSMLGVWRKHVPRRLEEIDSAN